MAGDIEPGKGGLGADTHNVAGDPGVPVEGTTQHLYGQGGIVEPLVQGGMIRPWKNGAPYGSQLHTEQQELTNQYKFLPGVAGRLRAATKRALGR